MSKLRISSLVLLVIGFVVLTISIAKMPSGFEPIDCDEVVSGSCYHFVVVNAVSSDAQPSNATITKVKQINHKPFYTQYFDSSIAKGYEVFYRLQANKNTASKVELLIRPKKSDGLEVGFYKCPSLSNECQPIKAQTFYKGGLPDIDYAISKNGKLLNGYRLNGKQSDGTKTSFAIDASALQKLDGDAKLRLVDANEQLVETRDTKEGVWRVSKAGNTIEFDPLYDADNSKIYHISAKKVPFAPKSIFFYYGMLPVLLIAASLWAFNEHANKIDRRMEKPINISLFFAISLLFLVRLYFALAVATLYIDRFVSVVLALLALWVIPALIAFYSSNYQSRQKVIVSDRYRKKRLVKVIKWVFRYFSFVVPVVAFLLMLVLWLFSGTTESGELTPFIFVKMPLQELYHSVLALSLATFKVNAQFHLEMLVIMVVIPTLVFFYNLSLSPNIKQSNHPKLTHWIHQIIGLITDQRLVLLVLILVLTALAIVSDDAKHSVKDKLPVAMWLLLAAPYLLVTLSDNLQLFIENKNKSSIFWVVASLFGLVGILLIALVLDKGSIIFVMAIALAGVLGLVSHNLFRHTRFARLHLIISFLVVFSMALVVGYKASTLDTLETNTLNPSSATIIKPKFLDSVCQLPKNIRSPLEFKLGTVSPDLIGNTDVLSDDKKCQQIQQKGIKTIADMDFCVRYCAMSNVDARLYSWINEHPYDLVLTNRPFGRLEELSRVRSYAIPQSVLSGDHGFYPYEYTKKGRLDGAMFEHVGGLVFVKAFGLIGIMLIIGIYASIVMNTQRGNYAARIYVVMLAFISNYILLQSFNVFPLVGHNLPLMVVSSFAKDFLPVCFGLVIYLCLYKQDRR